MIKLEINCQNMELEMRGSDDLILNELSLAVIRMLNAMEQSDGRPTAENLSCLVLSLIAMQEGNTILPC
ncbi:MAG: hypothetical protein IJJ69_11170 [Oscillospiraceae bacterium]|nr:hypothetical protein [Oscillospiraceae bacterium]